MHAVISRLNVAMAVLLLETFFFSLVFRFNTFSFFSYTLSKIKLQRERVIQKIT